jgi:hypothetical protein
VLFHVVNERHLRRRPILFTTSKSPLTTWGGVLYDHGLAQAVVDRVLEKGRSIAGDGPLHGFLISNLAATKDGAKMPPEYPQEHRR